MERIASPALLVTVLLMQHAVGFLGYKLVLVAYAELFVLLNPRVLFCRAALSPFSAQPVFLFGFVLMQVQDIALGLVELDDVLMGSPERVKVPLDGIASFQQVSCTTQLGVVHKFAEAVLKSCCLCH